MHFNQKLILPDCSSLNVIQQEIMLISTFPWHAQANKSINSFLLVPEASNQELNGKNNLKNIKGMHIWQKWVVLVYNPIRGQQIGYSIVYTVLHVLHPRTQRKEVRKYDLWEIYSPAMPMYHWATVKQTNTCQNRDTTEISEYLNCITLIIKIMAQHSTQNLNFIKLYKLHTTIRNYWLFGMYAQV